MKERFRTALAALALGLCGGTALAQPSASGELPPHDVPQPRRTVVVFAVRGALDAEVRAALQRLLGAELRGAGLVLRERAASAPLSAWARRAESEETPLLSAVLEVERDHLRLIVIDSERGRAIARELPGGVAENAANVEAVVSIVLSASRALLEGLEVASTPVEAMLGEAAPPAPAPASTKPNSTKTAASRAAERDRDAAVMRPTGVALHASVAATLTTFSEIEDVTPGVLVAAALTLPLGLELRLAASRQRTVTVVTEEGDFALERSVGSFATGLIFQSGAFTMLPEAALVAEWLARTDTAPAPGSTASSSRTTLRFGGELGARARFAFLPPLSAEVGGGVTYFGRSVRFTAGDDGETELARVVPLTFAARLGLDVAFD